MVDWSSNGRRRSALVEFRAHRERSGTMVWSEMAGERPFEDERPDDGPPRGFKTPKDFLAARGSEGAEAMVIRIGLNDAQLVLVDGEGFWDRWVYHSVDEATEIATSLGIDVHEGEYPEKTRVRINGYRRPKKDFERGAYPEQGVVGPVKAYPENRPRELQDAYLKEKRSKKTSG